MKFQFLGVYLCYTLCKQSFSFFLPFLIMIQAKGMKFSF